MQSNSDELTTSRMGRVTFVLVGLGLCSLGVGSGIPAIPLLSENRAGGFVLMLISLAGIVLGLRVLTAARLTSDDVLADVNSMALASKAVVLVMSGVGGSVLIVVGVGVGLESLGSDSTRPLLLFVAAGLSLFGAGLVQFSVWICASGFARAKVR